MNVQLIPLPHLISICDLFLYYFSSEIAKTWVNESINRNASKNYMMTMVNAVVLYNSKGGNTREVGMKIAEGLGCEVFGKKNIPKDLSGYDLVVAGSWMAAGMLMGANMFSKIAKKYSGKMALFFTSGAPEEEFPFGKEEGKPPKYIKDVMWEKMEKKLRKNPQIEILGERFCSKGDIKFEKKKPDYVKKHPSEQELEDAKAFGVGLKEKYSRSFSVA